MPLTHLEPSAESSDATSIPPAIEIRSLAPGDDSTAFRTLNEEWITRYFTLEAKDRETLNDPDRSILLKGGHHKEFSGIVFPTKRRIFFPQPDGRPAPEPLIISIDLDRIVLS